MGGKLPERSDTARGRAKKETPRSIADLAAAAEQQAGHWLDREVWWRVAMAAGSGAKAAKYFALARDAHRAEGTHRAEGIRRDTYYALLARYDEIRTSPEPALPALAP
ncbi:hypothetical protein [Streptomyces sp. PTD9-10]|uniref:hypothetical protein n=1 Tax=Streptomyces sp. PTD9-10 TaxID=3120151 RepID=UPI00300AA478